MTSEQTNPFERLTELAREKSSTRRRELLREVTDMFFDANTGHSEATDQHFDEILSTITREMDAGIRQEIAARFAHAQNAPAGLIHQLADDEINVSGPVLRHSPVLDDGALTRIIESRGQDHMRAIGARKSLSETVTGALVARADTPTLVALTQNQGARFSRQSMETLVSKSETEKDLQAPLVNHAALPPDLMNEMYFFVEERLRQSIMERNAALPKEELERAFAQARSRICGDGDRPEDFEDASHFIKAKKLRKQLTPILLAELARNNQRTHFYLAFAELTGLDFDTARRIWEPGKTEAVAIVCKASGLPRDLFATLVVLMNKDGVNDISAIKALGRTYDEISKDTADRVLRFWRMRKSTQAPAAA